MTDLLLLQTMSFVTSASDTTVYIAIGIIAALIIYLVIASAAGGKNKGMKYDLTKVSPRKKMRIFKKTAKKMVLNQDQIKMLEKMAVKYNLDSPLTLLINSRAYNNVFKSEINELDENPDLPTKETDKMLLFDIKQKLDILMSPEQNITSTKNLHTGQELMLVTEGNPSYTTYITANLKDTLAIKIPINKKGEMVKWGKWQPLQASFRRNESLYEFPTKLSGYVKIKGETCMAIQHSSSLTKKLSRKTPRKEINKLCYFFPISIIETGSGWKKRKQAVLKEQKGKMGTLLEISSGGCSIKSGNPLPAGSLLKIEFEFQRGKKTSAMGKVLSISKNANMQKMHIQFTRISKIALNNINSFVYGIWEKQSVMDL